MVFKIKLHYQATPFLIRRESRHRNQESQLQTACVKGPKPSACSFLAYSCLLFRKCKAPTCSACLGSWCWCIITHKLRWERCPCQSISSLSNTFSWQTRGFVNPKTEHSTQTAILFPNSGFGSCDILWLREAKHLLMQEVWEDMLTLARYNFEGRSYALRFNNQITTQVRDREMWLQSIIRAEDLGV